MQMTLPTLGHVPKRHSALTKYMRPLTLLMDGFSRLSVVWQRCDVLGSTLPTISFVRVDYS